MDDKDVGDFLKTALHHQEHVPSQRVIVMLIRKLVDERALRLGGMGYEHDIKNVLRDFCISPAEWAKAAPDAEKGGG